MTIEYNQQMIEVRRKQEQVLNIKESVAKMEADLRKTRNYIDKLRNDKEVCERRLENAARL